jgi:hypothetical protein
LWFAISTLRFLWESWYIINVRENRRGSQEWTIKHKYQSKKHDMSQWTDTKSKKKEK